jgi:hypothetical protein
MTQVQISDKELKERGIVVFERPKKEGETNSDG